MENPITNASLYTYQLMDPQRQQQLESDPEHYIKWKIGTFELLTVTSTKGGNGNNSLKIYLPDGLVESTLRWYHLLLGHCGSTRLYETISARFYAPRLSQRCKQYQCPDDCHRFKQLGQGYGLLPACEAQLIPWNEVCVDLIGPWKILLPDETELVINALTCIDPVTNLLEIIRINNKSSEHIAEQFAIVGCHDTPGPTDAFMIMVRNSLEHPLSSY